MMDPLGPNGRSRLMSRIRGKDTKPEMIVRRLAHGLGKRFRLHRRDLPGTPDLVFPRFNVAVFVHGCWWHRHPGCPKASGVKTRPDFWNAKFARNVTRDASVKQKLEEAGWSVLTIWECETKDANLVTKRLSSALCKPKMSDPVKLASEEDAH